MNDEEKKALALRYTQAENAPRVTARGKNELAEKIISLAKENDVPIYEDRDLLEILYSLNPGHEIPVELFEAVAEVLTFVYLANDKYKEFLRDHET